MADENAVTDDTETETPAAATDPGKTSEKADDAGDKVTDETGAKTEDKAGDDASLADGGEDEGKKAPASWPEDWRAQMSGGDEAVQKAISRYGSPQGVAKALKSAQEKISQGAAKADDPPEDEAELAKWREQKGIPESAEGYLDKLPDGLVIGDEDKELVSSFLETAHKHNRPPEEVAEYLNWYYETQAQTIEQRKEADAQYRQESKDELHSEWGDEYTANINLTRAAFAETSDDFRKSVLNARLPDGSKLGDSVEGLKWLSDLGRQLNPSATVLPSDGRGGLSSIQDEIAEIEKKMANKSSDYWKGPGAEKMQARYRDLVDARDRMSQ